MSLVMFVEMRLVQKQQALVLAYFPHLCKAQSTSALTLPHKQPMALPGVPGLPLPLVALVGCYVKHNGAVSYLNMLLGLGYTLLVVPKRLCGMN
jgi:hypothetical protein